MLFTFLILNEVLNEIYYQGHIWLWHIQRLFCVSLWVSVCNRLSYFICPQPRAKIKLIISPWRVFGWLHISIYSLEITFVAHHQRKKQPQPPPPRPHKKANIINAYGQSRKSASFSVCVCVCLGGQQAMTDNLIVLLDKQVSIWRGWALNEQVKVAANFQWGRIQCQWQHH